MPMSLTTIPLAIKHHLEELDAEKDRSVQLRIVSDICGLTQEANLTLSRQRRPDGILLEELESAFRQAVQEIRCVIGAGHDDAETMSRLVENISDRISIDLVHAKRRSAPRTQVQSY